MSRRVLGPAIGVSIDGDRLLDIARDYPEAVGTLREAGVPIREWGRTLLKDISDSAALEDRITAMTAWRPEVGAASSS